MFSLTHRPPPSQAAAERREYVDQLRALDGVKQRMSDARSMLAEAAHWERAVRQTEAVFDSQADADLQSVAEHIVKLERSVQVCCCMKNINRGCTALPPPLSHLAVVALVGAV